jgi:DNA-binding transcriptional LysR family regulator
MSSLFDRVGRGLKLTDSGRCTLAYFQGLRGTIEALGRQLQELHQGSAGKLVIGSIMAASPDLLTQALLQLKARYPLLAIEITVDTSDRLLELLHEGTLDLVVGRISSQTPGDHVFTPIAEEALSVIAAVDHPLAGQSVVRFKELLLYPWILQPVGSPMREVMEQEFKLHQATLPRGLIETASILTTTNLMTRSQIDCSDSACSRFSLRSSLTLAHLAVFDQKSAQSIWRDCSQRPPSQRVSGSILAIDAKLCKRIALIKVARIGYSIFNIVNQPRLA